MGFLGVKYYSAHQDGRQTLSYWCRLLRKPAEESQDSWQRVNKYWHEGWNSTRTNPGKGTSWTPLPCCITKKLQCQLFCTVTFMMWRRRQHFTHNVNHRVMHPNLMHIQPKFNWSTSTNDIMSNSDRIAAAFADLESQVVPNYSTTAMKHGVVRTTVMRRFTGKTVSNYEAATEHRHALRKC